LLIAAGDVRRATPADTWTAAAATNVTTGRLSHIETKPARPDPIDMDNEMKLQKPRRDWATCRKRPTQERENAKRVTDGFTKNDGN
jgi:hypothetical protein